VFWQCRPRVWYGVFPDSATNARRSLARNGAVELWGHSKRYHYPTQGVTMGRGGVLYGVAVGGCGAVFSLTPPINGGAWAETVLYEFKCAPDGSAPDSRLVIGENGVLYGTTNEGGVNPCLTFGCGTVFALTPPASAGAVWAESVLWSFGANGDGFYPVGGVLLGSGGTLFGATQAGGTGNCGLVYSLVPPANTGNPWVETVIYTFPAAAKMHPITVALGADGILYGTAGLNDKDEQGDIAFSLTPPATHSRDWTSRTLWTFPDRNGHAASDQPNGPLIVAERNGALFGATAYRLSGEGTIFELIPPKVGVDSWTKRQLDFGHTLGPSLGLAVGNPGVIYGTDSVASSVWSLTP
jgi:hypothetical protein